MVACVPRLHRFLLRLKVTPFTVVISLVVTHFDAAVRACHPTSRGKCVAVAH